MSPVTLPPRRPPCPIAGVEVIPIRMPEGKPDDLDSSADTVLIRLTDQAGRQGIGEADAPPEVVKAFIEMPTGHLWSQNLSRLLIGMDPLDLTANYDRLYEAILYPGRRGLGIHVLSAIDLAMHDLAGHQLGLPAFQLMGGARRPDLRPYCTIYPGVVTERAGVEDLMRETERQFARALEIGFDAVKMEVLYYDHVSDRQMIDLIRRGRRMLGDGPLLALDFGYRWRDWQDARRVLEAVVECDIYFAEACLQHDDMAGHARLAAVSPIRICGAEFAATRFEIKDWVEQTSVSVVQPDIARCGGLTEIRRIAEYCSLHAVSVIPHGWKTGILAHAGRHFQAACPAAPLFEWISPLVYDSPLRRDLVWPEPEIRQGRMALPDAPGLGFVLNEDLVARWRTDRS